MFRLQLKKVYIRGSAKLALLVNLWRMWKSPDSVGAWVQPGEKLNLWLLLAHRPLLHKMSVLYSIVWFQVGVQLYNIHRSRREE